MSDLQVAVIMLVYVGMCLSAFCICVWSGHGWWGLVPALALLALKYHS